MITLPSSSSFLAKLSDRLLVNCFLLVNVALLYASDWIAGSFYIVDDGLLVKEVTNVFRNLLLHFTNTITRSFSTLWGLIAFDRAWVGLDIFYLPPL